MKGMGQRFDLKTRTKRTETKGATSRKIGLKEMGYQDGTCNTSLDSDSDVFSLTYL